MACFGVLRKGYGRLIHGRWGVSSRARLRVGAISDTGSITVRGLDRSSRSSRSS